MRSAGGPKAGGSLTVVSVMVPLSWVGGGWHPLKNQRPAICHGDEREQARSPEPSFLFLNRAPALAFHGNFAALAGECGPPRPAEPDAWRAPGARSAEREHGRTCSAGHRRGSQQGCLGQEFHGAFDDEVAAAFAGFGLFEQAPDVGTEGIHITGQVLLAAEAAGGFGLGPQKDRRLYR